MPSETHHKHTGSPAPRSITDESATTKRLSEILWNKNEDKAYEALQTDFIQGIQSGLLDPRVFGKYNVQDAVYLHQATRCCETARSKAEQLNDMQIAECLKERVEILTEYTNSMFEDWHIKDPNAIKLGEAAQAYLDHARTIAETKSPFYLLIAMLPCDALWRWLAVQIKSGINETNVYSFWIQNILSDNNYRMLADFIDDYAEQFNYNQTEAEQIYRSAIEKEVKFFTSATTN